MRSLRHGKDLKHWQGVSCIEKTINLHLRNCGREDPALADFNCLKLPFKLQLQLKASTNSHHKIIFCMIFFIFFLKEDNANKKLPEGHTQFIMFPNILFYPVCASLKELVCFSFENLTLCNV